MLSSVTPAHAARLLVIAARRAGTLRALARKPPVLQAADAHYEKFLVAVQYAFAVGRKAIRNVGHGNAPAVAAKAVHAALLDVLEPIVRKTMAAGGEAGAKRLSGLRAAAVPEMNRRYEGLAAAYRAAALTFKFDVKNQKAIDWAKKHAAELATELSETTERDIRKAIERSLTDGEDPYDAILEAVGDEARAQMIAHTEIMIAANEGQRMAWEQAVDDGYLSKNAERVWIATPGACPECEALDGERASVSGSYPSPGEDGPPLHPGCRCTEGITG